MDAQWLQFFVELMRTDNYRIYILRICPGIVPSTSVRPPLRFRFLYSVHFPFYIPLADPNKEVRQTPSSSVLGGYSQHMMTRGCQPQELHNRSDSEGKANEYPVG